MRSQVLIVTESSTGEKPTGLMFDIDARVSHFDALLTAVCINSMHFGPLAR
jgi:hypothetical protein